MLTLLLACAAEGPPTGVVLVSLDTLRADRLGAWGSSAGLTPNLDRFAAEAVVFDHAFAPANETLYSHAALFSAQAPHRLGPLDGSFRLPARTPTLAEAFAGAGWSTGAFVAGGHLSRGFGLDRGFGTYDDAEAWGSLQGTGARALRWIDALPDGAPFFCFVHGYDTHDRYLKPSPYGYAFADPAYAGAGARIGREEGGSTRVLGGSHLPGEAALEVLPVALPRFARGRDVPVADPAAEALTPEDVAHLAELYDGAVTWADAQFGRLMAGLDARGLLDHVVVVVVSDHGEELGEEGAFAHRTTLDDEVTRVPLLVRLPGGAHGGRRVTDLVSLVDVAPTLLELTGAPAALYGDGRSLAGALDGGPGPGRDVVVSEGGLRLLSARSATARLTFEGLGLGNPHLAAALRAAPLDGVSLRLSGPEAELPALRAALVAHVEAR